MEKVKLIIELSPEQFAYLQKKAGKNSIPEKEAALILAMHIAGRQCKEKQKPIKTPKTMKEVTVGTVFDDNLKAGARFLDT